MYPPALCGLMQPSSTGVLLGVSLLVIQPSSDLPSNRRSQPSAFSLAVNSLSAADAMETKDIARTERINRMDTRQRSFGSIPSAIVTVQLLEHRIEEGLDGVLFVEVQATD